MEQQPIIIERTYNAPVEKVWKALTDKAQMKEWYFDIPDFKPEVGFEFEFIGKGKKGEEYLHKCKITELVPQKKLTHSWRYDGYEGNSFVTFELSAEGDKTHIKLTHTGLETFPPIEAFAKSNFVEGWTYIIGKGLKEFVEE
ncbi:SRPBCC domain-containing protein [Taibaiella lutea]|uniref:SRPBCC domain-containing protein n=1 Tax=Taibaiella lutea TaxID=2608001 RepID=A0A5M6CJ71_9BACT|nr:SRPBCC domain-containing protein [Taibaiella lutea]KAA5535076.1 SRPBCC domain-containing protein [Taibaiella lutea]